MSESCHHDHEHTYRHLTQIEELIGLANATAAATGSTGLRVDVTARDRTIATSDDLVLGEPVRFIVSAHHPDKGHVVGTASSAYEDRGRALSYALIRFTEALGRTLTILDTSSDTEPDQ